MTKHDRIKANLEYKGYRTAKSFASKLCIAASHLSDIDKRNDNQKLKGAIYSNLEFNDLNWEWLLTGEGPMLNPDPLPTPSPTPPSAPLGDGVLDRALWSEATLDSQALFGDILGENVQKCYDRLLVKQGRSPESPPSAKTETPLKQAA